MFELLFSDELGLSSQLLLKFFHLQCKAADLVVLLCHAFNCTTSNKLCIELGFPVFFS